MAAAMLAAAGDRPAAFADFDDDERHQLPSLSYCTSGKMEEVLLAAPAEATSNEVGHVPQNSIDPNPSVAWVSAEKDEMPCWSARLPSGSRAPIALIVVHATTPEASGLSADQSHLRGIQVEVLNVRPGDKLVEAPAAWVSGIQSAPVGDAQGEEDRLFFFVPSVLGTAVRVRKVKDAPGPLGLRTVQCMVMPTTKFKLSQTILTIDKYSVAQPFSVGELAQSTTYANLFTSSAVHNLGQDSRIEDLEGVALNLTHHLSGIWSAQTPHMEHGRHKQTVFTVMMDLMSVVKPLLVAESKLVDVKAPCYVFGDIHGNFEDLHYFAKNLVPFGHIKYASHAFVFLGDYVDRGKYDVECLAYLLGLKVQAPKKVILLRGNHEDRRQNARLEESFYAHAVKLFGKEDGAALWHRANEVFDAMPICAVIDNRIFCCHGGVPRVPRDAAGQPMRIRQVMERLPTMIDQISDSENQYLQAAADVLWGDPSQDTGKGKEEYFQPNEARGCGCCFGQKAVDEFLELNGFEYLMRAHQFFSFGVNISKGGKVITLFSSSNYCDHHSCAGCALVTSDDRIQLLMKEHMGRTHPTS
eukprot:TRINITY_DN10219_c0_g1_i1.p1 TRINITY_DN10219_c0_g1~~TRINITY_DN10219_c0_g1_i1.p1  ORF type:complete len:601 (+),score=177.47 TRINITY_DN10219_c0_g1_i1:55-1803(+)